MLKLYSITTQAKYITETTKSCYKKPVKIVEIPVTWWRWHGLPWSLHARSTGGSSICGSLSLSLHRHLGRLSLSLGLGLGQLGLLLGDHGLGPSRVSWMKSGWHETARVEGRESRHLVPYDTSETASLIRFKRVKLETGEKRFTFSVSEKCGVFVLHGRGSSVSYALPLKVVW